MTAAATEAAWRGLDGFGGSDKRMSLGEAVRTHVRPHDTVHVAYSDARPNAALLELVRQFAGTDPNLTLVTAGLVSSQHATVAAGVVTRVIASFAGENFPSARPSPLFQRAVREGRVEVENWTLWTLVARLMAGALGVPYMPVRSLAGSDLAAEHEGRAYASLDDPFAPADEPTGVVSALRPDVVLLHGVAADAAGNVIASAPYGEGLWGSLAARRGVVACVERVVDTEEIRASNALVRIPAHCVVAVCEVPFGSHPYGLYNPSRVSEVASYVEDERFIREVYVASKSDDAFGRWLDEWVLGTRDHGEYLRKLGRERLDALVTESDADGWVEDLPALPDGEAAATGTEAMVVTAARRIAGRVRDRGLQAVLAGIGQSHLASWLAVWQLKQERVEVELMAEIGMLGFLPRPGEPFIFAKRNLPTATVLTDAMTVLGTLVAGPGTRSLAVIGAAQVDAEGNTNSTFDERGDFLVGSGGANDIASAADEVLVTIAHDRNRLVDRLPHVTCPGRNVRTIVTSAGVFERRAGRLVLTAYRPGPADARAAVDWMRANCDWEFDVADDLVAEPPPEPEELRLLRSFDPGRTLLRGARTAQ